MNRAPHPGLPRPGAPRPGASAEKPRSARGTTPRVVAREGGGFSLGSSRRRPGLRLVWMLPAGVALLAGLDAGLLLLGLPAPVTAERLPDVHGMLLVLGFVGTLISLERATALARPLGYVAPALLGIGGVLLVGVTVQGDGLGVGGCDGAQHGPHVARFPAGRPSPFHEGRPEEAREAEVLSSSVTGDAYPG